ncbi:BatA domain-containing protein [Pontibacter sp. JH31]|uniref:BatA domain-containing protein n=1 Tax=Pontibacter aquaedesilientis TaxID=2766980 RepID=A0ABR7XGB9_9BACT|nr:BatA domain-containing protein [Pontibacter aquaedesilientis]MBD1397322.1 BatA domain-containing protein [Pontibacter aquaedesilientis]
MTFLSPIWLFAASAVLVPIAIHLWNRRQGKTVKVGNLRWLEPSASRRWSSIQLSDVWLLVLRCCILLLVAVALAKPVWEGAATSQQAQKAVLISPELLHSTAIRQIKPTVDNLLQRGYTLHRYTSTFEVIPAEAWQTLSGNPTDSVVSSGNYWGLLPALAQRYDQAEDSVWLFTSDQQRHFSGTPTALQENIRWVPVALESTTNWVQAAYSLSSDSLLLITGHSNREGTTYHSVTVAALAQETNINGSLVKLSPEGDSLTTQQGNSVPHRIEINKEPLRIGIAYDEGQQSEVRYLQAAVQAISHYTGIPIETQQISKTTPADTSAAWLFWLSSEEVPSTWLEQVQEKGAKLWVQSASEPTATTAQLASAGIEKISIHQLATTGIAPNNAYPIWQITTGEPLLSEQRLGLGKVYHFRSGFGPAWSQLGQSTQLPELLLPLILPEQAASHYDARALDETQLKPAMVQPISKQDKQERQQYSLIPWLVLLAFLLFLAERIITSKRKTA